MIFLIKNNEEVICYGSLEHEWNNCKKLVDIYVNNYLGKYDFKKYVIKNESIILLVEDSFIISFSVFFEEKIIYDRYGIVIEELLPNEIFSFSENKYRFKDVDINSDINGNYPISYFYKRFTGEYEKFGYSKFVDTPKIKSMFDEINQKIPELKLKQRYNDWNGWKYYFIVYELNYKNNNGVAIHYTQNKFPLNYAYSSEKKLEELFVPSIETDSLFVNDIYYYNKYALSRNFISIREKMYEDYYNNVLKLETNAYGYTSLYNKYLYYYIVPKMIKKESDIHKITTNIIIDVQKGLYKNVEKNLYTIGKYKWKSEELMVKCIKKIFNEYEVIQQFKPYFLYVNKGQLSFDAYIPKLKIAFEYQGKQHYEPIEYFGGEESFKKQQYRDKIKKEISKKNNVKLIYVNYWEDITIELITKKLIENNINL